MIRFWHFWSADKSRKWLKSTLILANHYEHTLEYIEYKKLQYVQINSGEQFFFSEFQIGFAISFSSFMRNIKAAFVYFGFVYVHRIHIDVPVIAEIDREIEKEGDRQRFHPANICRSSVDVHNMWINVSKC